MEEWNLVHIFIMSLIVGLPIVGIMVSISIGKDKK